MRRARIEKLETALGGPDASPAEARIPAAMCYGLHLAYSDNHLRLADCSCCDFCERGGSLLEGLDEALARAYSGAAEPP